MFLLSWFIVSLVLFGILCILFVAFITWLAHSLEGYPMFLMLNADRDISSVPLSLEIQSMPESLSVSGACADSAAVRARNLPDEIVGRQARRF
jgi:hypothetical protein